MCVKKSIASSPTKMDVPYEVILQRRQNFLRDPFKTELPHPPWGLHSFPQAQPGSYNKHKVLDVGNM